jgi:hypothetical protein
MSFPVDSFVSPACDACNNKFSLLEDRAERIMVGLLAGEQLRGWDLSLILDWFDKIRIGIWLTLLALNPNVIRVDPKFRIMQRLGQHDRALLIGTLSPPGQQLLTLCTETPAFLLAPCALGLIVNQLLFINVSREFLFSRRLGFPYPDSISWNEDGSHQVHLVPGTGRIDLPLFPQTLACRMTTAYQAIFAFASSSPEARLLYDTAHVRRFSLDWEHGVGIPIIQNTITQVGSGALPDRPVAPDMRSVKRGILELQDFALARLPSPGCLPQDQLQALRASYETALRYNQELRDVLEQEEGVE